MAIEEELRLSDEALARTPERHHEPGSDARPGPPADPERWQQADRLFAEALELPKTERDGFVEKACSGDPVLLGLVEELLAFDDGALGCAPEASAAGVVQRVAATADVEQIGPYRLVGQLGSGGLGTVYLAEQDEPVERKVALKLIKPGMDSEQVLARFEGERQALALMDHANVATVYDAGCTEAGRPYIAMEYVPGREITEHCDRAGLGFRDRIRLFLQVCDGAQHAHQKGLIHRDLKPSNIMVKSSLDEPATVKIIDFGVAKSLQRKLSSHAAQTQLGTFVGTPIYSSPEQILGRFVETDTRSDIYSLGVVLYELLVGTPPHSLDELEGKTQQEIARMIGEQPPSSPIERFTTSIEDTEKVAKHRSLSVEQMQRRLRGDVSWILLKCLERRPEDRYPSVSELRKDLERWLEGLPLEARPSTGLYRLRKLVRRHRTGVTVTALVALALLATTAAAVLGFKRATRAAEEAELAADFQVEQLQELDPAVMGSELRTRQLEAFRQGLGKQGLEPAAIEARVEKFESSLRHTNFTDLSLSLLDGHLFARAEAKIEEKYAGAPRLQARLWQSVADTRRKLGRYEGAVEPQQRALEVRLRELGPEHPLTLESLRRRGQLRMAMGRLDDAEADLRQAAEMHRRALGDEHLQTLHAINDLGEVLRLRGKLDEAEVNRREALDTAGRVLGDQHPAALSFANDLGLVLSDQGKLDEAESYYRMALEGERRVLGDQHPKTLSVLNNLGLVLHNQDKLDEAERLLREALEVQREVLGSEHHHTLFTINNLGLLLQDQGKLDKAESYFREALETGRRVLGDRHLDTLVWFNNLGGLLHIQGRFDEAEPYLREALVARREVLGDQHRYTLYSMNGLGLMLWDQDKLDEAEPYFREALETGRRVLGDEHLDTLVWFNNLGGLLRDQGRLDEAEPYLRQALETRRRQFGDQHTHTLYSVKNLASLLSKGSQHPEAAELLNEALPTAAEALGEDHRLTAEIRSLLGEALVGLGEYEQAETSLLDAYEDLQAALPPGKILKLRAAAERIVSLYEAWGKPAQAAEWRSRLSELDKRATGEY